MVDGEAVVAGVRAEGDLPAKAADEAEEGRRAAGRVEEIGGGGLGAVEVEDGDISVRTDGEGIEEVVCKRDGGCLGKSDERLAGVFGENVEVGEEKAGLVERKGFVRFLRTDRETTTGGTKREENMAE